MDIATKPPFHIWRAPLFAEITCFRNGFRKSGWNWKNRKRGIKSDGKICHFYYCDVWMESGLDGDKRVVNIFSTVTSQFEQNIIYNLGRCRGGGAKKRKATVDRETYSAQVAAPNGTSSIPHVTTSPNQGWACFLHHVLIYDSSDRRRCWITTNQMYVDKSTTFVISASPPLYRIRRAQLSLTINSLFRNSFGKFAENY